jgi:hypothetical protein
MKPEPELLTTKTLPTLTVVQNEIERILKEESGATKHSSAVRYLAAVVSGNTDYLTAVEKSHMKGQALRRATAKAAAEAAGLKVVE